jgi:hypothetical protein
MIYLSPRLQRRFQERLAVHPVSLIQAWETLLAWVAGTTGNCSDFRAQALHSEAKEIHKMLGLLGERRDS